MHYILLIWLCVIRFQIIACFSGLIGGCLLEGWGLIEGGAYYFFLCLGWALIRGSAYSRGCLIEELWYLIIQIFRGPVKSSLLYRELVILSVFSRVYLAKGNRLKFNISRVCIIGGIIIWSVDCIYNEEWNKENWYTYTQPFSVLESG